MSLSPSAQHVIAVKPQLNINAIKGILSDHPDRQFANTITDYAKFGVPLGYEGPRVSRVCENWPSSKKFSTSVEATIAKDSSKGRKVGPFTSPPFDTFVGSPMGAFEKRSSKKIRVIHDLSWPPGRSINDGIVEDCSIEYITMDTIARLVREHGQGALMSKLDLEDAYKHITVRPEDWDLLGSTWITRDETGKETIQYWFETVLAFGLKSAPKLFNLFAEALKYGMLKKGATVCEHYLDDYFTCSSAGSTTCQENLQVMLDTCHTFGFAVQPAKVVGPVSELEYLGIIIDSQNMQLKISQERLSRIMDELRRWRSKRSCTKRQLLSIIGKLSFISRVVRSSRTFIRRMIELSKHAKYLHHHLRLNNECQKDISWWLAYLPSWNGVSLFYDVDWSSNADLELWTDASDQGIGAYYKGQWISQSFCNTFEQFRHYSINWRELFAIIIATATWGHELICKRVLYHCDNLAVVHILQKGTSTDGKIMCLVRTLFFLCAKYNIECSAVHVPGINNSIADALSRLDLQRFRSEAPNACDIGTEPVLPNFSDYN